MVKRRIKSERRKETIARLTLRDGFRCWWCKCDFGECVPVTIDHIVPLSRGGDNRTANLRLACGSCNHRRKDEIGEKAEKAPEIPGMRRWNGRGGWEYTTP